MYTYHKNDIQQYNDDPAHSAEETHPGPVSDSANYIHSYYTYTLKDEDEQFANNSKLMF